MDTAYSGVYRASVIRTSAQIPLWVTSDTFGTTVLPLMPSYLSYPRYFYHHSIKR